MKKPLKIISIDGTRGAGKTSQISMLSKHFKSLGFMVSTLKAGHDVQSGLIALKFIESFLPKADDTIVILDGSIARPMVSELIDGIPSTTVIDKYKHVMHDYEVLDKKYGIVGLLFVMDDIDKANERLLKHNELTETNDKKPVDLQKEVDIVSGLRTFDNHIASKNVKFHTFNIEPDDTILAINSAVVEYLTENYQIPKLVKTDDDW